MKGHHKYQYLLNQKLKLGSNSREAFVNLGVIWAFNNFLGIYLLYLPLKVY